MQGSFKLFGWGLLISFLGSLPLGTMNVVATGIAVSRGTADAFIYSAGSLLVEILYVRIVLALMEKVYKHRKVFRVLELLTAVALLLLATGSFIAAIRMTGFKSSLPVDTISPFLSGVILSAINPLHFAFWIGWSTVLMNKKVLRPGARQYTLYITGISLGTMAGFTVFIYGGNYLVTRLKNDQNIINWVIGGVLLITAMIQFYKIGGNRVVGRGAGRAPHGISDRGGGGGALFSGLKD